jgi:hypothetical protein
LWQRSKLKGSRGSAPSYDPAHRFLQEIFERAGRRKFIEDNALDVKNLGI